MSFKNMLLSKKVTRTILFFLFHKKVNRKKIDKKIIDNPKYLMQSVDLTYARYRYLTEDKGIEIDIKKTITNE